MRTSNLATFISLVISFIWAFLLGVFVLSGTRTNVWYDMDFSIWMICFFYAFIHLVIGKVWSLILSPLIKILRQNTDYNFEEHWTEDFQLIFGSFWPVSVPLAVLLFLFLLVFGRKKQGKANTH
jgi:hypothetical protein